MLAASCSKAAHVLCLPQSWQLVDVVHDALGSLVCLQALEASCHWMAWATEQGMVTLDNLQETAEAGMPAGKQHALAAVQLWLDGQQDAASGVEQGKAAHMAKDVHQLVFRLLLLMTLVRHFQRCHGACISPVA